MATGSLTQNYSRSQRLCVRTSANSRPSRLKAQEADVARITSDTLNQVWDELTYRLEVCRVTNGAHIEHFNDTQRLEVYQHIQDLVFSSKRDYGASIPSTKVGYEFVKNMDPSLSFFPLTFKSFWKKVILDIECDKNDLGSCIWRGYFREETVVGKRSVEPNLMGERKGTWL
ncbi:hypothetical protein TNCV_127511 [Trichonephila clavipes]|nr:hypothetical protein TNCV_127511 [Trichonephila clavipes]